MNKFITFNCHRWLVTIIKKMKCMNQNGKHISACIWDSEDEEYDINFVPNYLEFVNNIFNPEKFDFVSSRSSWSRHSLGA